MRWQHAYQNHFTCDCSVSVNRKVFKNRFRLCSVEHFPVSMRIGARVLAHASAIDSERSRSAAARPVTHPTHPAGMSRTDDGQRPLAARLHSVLSAFAGPSQFSFDKLAACCSFVMNAASAGSPLSHASLT